MRLPSCVIYRGGVALCITELTPGLIDVRAAGASAPWTGRLTRAETAEVAALLERDRAMLSGRMLEAA